MKGVVCDSGWQGERCTCDFVGQPSDSIGLTITQGCIADAGQLVGERTGCLVVIGAALDGERPLAQAVDGFPSAHGDGGGTHHGARAVSEEHAQVAIAPFGDASEMASGTRGMLLRRQAEPGGEVSSVAEVADGAGGCRHHRRRGQQADPGDRQQRSARGRLSRQCGQFALELRDAYFEQTDFFDQQGHCAAEECRYRCMRIGKHTADLFDAEATALRNDDPELAAEARAGR